MPRPSCSSRPQTCAAAGRAACGRRRRSSGRCVAQQLCKHKAPHCMEPLCCNGGRSLGRQFVLTLAGPGRKRGGLCAAHVATLSYKKLKAVCNLWLLVYGCTGVAPKSLTRVCKSRLLIYGCSRMATTARRRRHDIGCRDCAASAWVVAAFAGASRSAAGASASAAAASRLRPGRHAPRRPSLRVPAVA